MMPLAGIRIVDLTNLLPGPFCSAMLVDLGAEVIKVERPPFGDPTRKNSPLLFKSVNRNKKSVLLDLKEPGDKLSFEKLLRECDVLLEGFRPGVLEKLGFGFERVRSINQKIIYCSLSGYGQDGPYRDLTGHDVNYLGVAGALSISGNPSDGPAAWGGVQVADLASAMYAVVAVMAALRQTEQTGKGVYLDVSMTDCVLAWMAPRIADYYEKGKPSKEKFMGRGAYGAFKTLDEKYLAIGCVEDYFWERLCGALGIWEMARDGKYDNWFKRNMAADEINVILAAHFLTKTREEWLEILSRADVPCSIVNYIEELDEDPQIKARDLIHWKEGVPIISFPVKGGGFVTKESVRAPKLGEHTKAVLDSLE